LLSAQEAKPIRAIAARINIFFILYTTNKGIESGKKTKGDKCKPETIQQKNDKVTGGKESPYHPITL
jgi:hypothetical protein